MDVAMNAAIIATINAGMGGIMSVATNTGLNRLFLLIVNNALTAGWVILAVLILRIVCKKAPRWISCLFWGIVALRLIFPFSVESALSLIPNNQPIPVDIEYTTKPSLDTGLAVVDKSVNPVIMSRLAPTHAAGLSPLQIMITFASALWLVGVAGMLFYALVSYVLLRKRVRAKAIDTPFILGFFRPQIYLPDRLPLEEAEYVLAHEQNHIRRGDHIWKPLGFLLLSVYWFQPLAWIAYALFSKDMEYACDEMTTKDRDRTWRANYCQALLNCSAKQKHIAACPVAFGEVAVKDRVKSVLNYKRPAFWILCAGIVACFVLVVCFLTNPPRAYAVKVVVPANCVGEFAYSDEEVCARGSGKITLTAGENLPDTEVMLVAIEGTGEMKTIAPFYMTPGMPVQVTLEKDTWYKLCVNVPNDTDEPQEVYVNVKGVELRIADYQPSADARLPYMISADEVGREENIIILPKGYSIGAYKEALGLAGGTLIEPVSYHCYENSPVYEMEDWYYSGFLCKFPAQVLDITFTDGQPGAYTIPLQNHTVRDGMMVMTQLSYDGWYTLSVKDTHDLFTGALLSSTMEYAGELQGIDLDQYDAEAAYYYFYFVKEGEPYYYYLSLSAKEFDYDQVIRIAQTVKLPAGE
ncbi:MAG: hypothetical protein IJ794_10365 [Lachnospiraceae bacterium]|nr:hypothetical protein [Lachnospiraceae bacterium]